MANAHNQTLPIGTRLGVYEVNEAIHITRYDITYRGWNHHLKAWIEIQEYFPCDFAIRNNDGLGVDVKNASDKEKFDYGLKLFSDQGEVLTQIEHPNIVMIENVLQFNGTAYLISVNREGVVLAKAVDLSPSSVTNTEVNSILESILNALQTIHSHDIVHGGIQPESIFLSKQGEAFLTGFASARIALAALFANSPNELFNRYSAPECFQLENVPTPASDLYALGATIYECLLHKEPASSRDRLEVLSKHGNDPVSVSETDTNEYGPTLLQAITWMLKLEPKDRPQSAAEILALLASGNKTDVAGAAASKSENKAIDNSSAEAKKPWFAVMAGVLGLIIAGFWLFNKTATIDDNSTNIVTSQPIAPPVEKPEQTAASSEEASKPAIQQPIATVTPSEQTQTPEIVATQVEQQAKPIDKPTETLDAQNSSAVVKPIQESVEAKTPNLPVSKPVPKQEPKHLISAKTKSVSSHKVAVNQPTRHSSKKQNTPVKTHVEGSVEGYLAAANKAMAERRLTVPSGNNAYHYYQLALAKDPSNRLALAGRQKIVDKYAWVIRQSKTDGDVAKAERVLKKAETVLPDDPKLQKFRAEFQNRK